MDFVSWAKRFFHRYKIFIITALIILLLVGIYSLYGVIKEKRLSRVQAISVTIATAVQKPVTVQYKTIGTVQASDTAEVKSQVDGQIISVAFHRGDMVAENQLLFIIDPRPYQVQLQQAIANLARDQATLVNSKLTLDRDRALLKKNFVAQSVFDQDTATYQSNLALVQADEAAIANAKLQLQYCYIRSPFAGRAGDYQVDVGNVVKTAQGTILVTINRVQPIDLSFAVPQQYYSLVRQSQTKTIPITVTLENSKLVLQGSLNFVDNQISTSTGTLLLKAEFPNADLKLWPGQYVDVSIPVQHLDKAIVVPTPAIQEGQQGSYVYVVSNKQSAQYRRVTAGPMVDQETIILSGLNAGEKIVTAGQLQLTDGTPLKIVNGSNGMSKHHEH
jgi:multidrug efflux system membrane fusion protein